MPGSFLVKGNEGRAISNVDANSYINEDDKLTRLCAIYGKFTVGWNPG